MGHHCFDVTLDDKVAHIVLSRPEKRNSMSPEFWDELPAIVRDIDDNARARAIVISSTGPHFSAGLDIKAFQRNYFDHLAELTEPELVVAIHRALNLNP